MNTTHQGPRSADDPPTPAAVLAVLLSGFQVSQAIYVIAKLDVATILTGGPRTVTDLADQVGANADALRRLLRSLSPLGLFHRRGNDIIELGPLGAPLSGTHPQSLRALALYWMETHYLPFSELLHTATAGESAAERYLGMPFADWISADPARTDLQSRVTAHDVTLDGYRLPTGNLVADIGGDGTVVTKLIAGQPERRLVVAGCDSVPRADLYVLSMYRHDWDDTFCHRLLQSIAATASPGARLVAIEMIIPPADQPHFAKTVDLVTLAMHTGRQRSTEEFRALLGKTGFTLDQVIPTTPPFSIIEATLN